MASPKPKPKPRKGAPEKPQSERFKETARNLDVDESGRAFDVALKKLVMPKRAKKR